MSSPFELDKQIKWIKAEERLRIAKEILGAIDREGNTGYDDISLCREWWLPFKEKYIGIEKRNNRPMTMEEYEGKK